MFIEGQYATIEHRYSYDGLYQLTAAQGTYRNHPYGPKNSGGQWRRDYSQSYRYDAFFNMALKTSRDTRVPLISDRSPLNYSLEYRYENPEKPHQATRIGGIITPTMRTGTSPWNPNPLCQDTCRPN